jgi:hypothetical protein
LIISPDRGQFQCPLCNKIGNFLLPIRDAEKEKLSLKCGDEMSDGLSWVDWILTDTEMVTATTATPAADQERGKKRELSKDSESREDILAALTREINDEEEEDEAREQSQTMPARSTLPFSSTRHFC